MSEQNYWTNFSGHRLSRRQALRAGGMAGAGLAGLALIGCGDDDDGPSTTPTATAPGATGTPSATETPVEGHERQGGVLPSHSAMPDENFNVVSNTWEGHSLSGEHIYDRLISTRPDERQYTLDAAESVELPDDVTVVMKLKPGQVYQDRAPVNGRPVEAQDIVDMQYFARDEVQAHNRSFQLNRMESAEAPDDETVVWNLNAPYAYLWSGQALGYAGNMCIVPRELLDNFNTNEPIGSGPYQMARYQFQVEYEYERNPTYRRASEGMPFIDRRIRRPLTDSTAIETAFRGGQSRIWGQQGGAIPADIAQRVINDMGDRINVTDYESLGPMTLNMSSKNPRYDDIRIREAFYRIFRPEPFIELVAAGRAVPVPGVLPISLTPWLLDWDDTLPGGATVREQKRHDSDEAIALLEAAGWDFDQEIVLSTIEGPISPLALQVWENDLRQHGMTNITYKVMPFGEWTELVSNTGDYDFCATGHPAEDNPARMMRAIHTTTGYIHNSFNISDPEIDALIEASEVEVDFDAQTQLVKDAQALMLEKYAHLWYIYTAQAYQFTYAEIQDFEFNPGLLVMHRPEAWIDES